MTTAVAPGAQITALRLDTLAPHPANRKHFDELKLAELTKSVAIDGVLVPLLVRPVGGNHHQIIAGERRWRAAKGAKLSTVPCIVRDMTDEQALERLITDNLQREDPHPLEEAETFDAWLQMDGHDVAGLAAKVGKSPTYIYSRLQLRRLGDEARDAVWAGKVPVGHAQVIARLEEKDQARALEMVHLGADGQAVRSLANFLECLVEFDLQLADAPFPLADGALCPAAGSCSACPKRTGFKGGMFPELAEALQQTEDQEGVEDTCLDPECFQEKTQAFIARQLAETATAHGSVVRLTTRGSDRWPSSSSASVPFGVWKVAKEGAKGAVPGVIVSLQGMGHGIKPAPKLGAVYWVTLKPKPTAKTEAAKKEKATERAAESDAERTKRIREQDREEARHRAISLAIMAHAPAKVDPTLTRVFIGTLDDWDRNHAFRRLGMKPIDVKKATPAQLSQVMIAGILGGTLERNIPVLAAAVGVDLKKFVAAWEKQPHPGTCSKCHCTETTACQVDGTPCGWANKEKTLCTACQKPAPAKGAKKKAGAK